MKRILCALMFAMLVTVPAEAKQVWFRWNGYVVVDYRYVGKKLNPKLPKDGPLLVRWKMPVGLSADQQDAWLDVRTLFCFDVLKGEQFNNLLPLNGWVCVKPKNVSR